MRRISRMLYCIVTTIAFCCVVCRSEEAPVASRTFFDLDVDQKRDALRDAIHNQNVQRVQQLLRADAPYNDPAVFGCACSSGNVDVVMLFLNHHVSLNAPDIDGWYPIHHAAAAGRKSIVRLLHSKGVPYEQQTQKEHDTALHLAAYYGRRGLVEFLFRKTKKEYHIKNPEGDGVAHHIAASGKVALMNWYLTHAGEHEIDFSDQHGMLPVFVAALHGHMAMVKYLLERRPQHLRAKNVEGFQLIGAAAYRNNTDLVNYLRTRGQSLSDRAYNRSTPAHLAAGKCFMKLVKQAIDVDRLSPLATDEKGWSLIHYAAQGGCLETIKMLHDQYSVPLNLLVDDGKTAANIAADSNHTHVLAYLKERGVDISVNSRTAVSPRSRIARATIGNVKQWVLHRRHPKA